MASLSPTKAVEDPSAPSVPAQNVHTAVNDPIPESKLSTPATLGDNKVDSQLSAHDSEQTQPSTEVAISLQAQAQIPVDQNQSTDLQIPSIVASNSTIQPMNKSDVHANMDSSFNQNSVNTISPMSASETKTSLEPTSADLDKSLPQSQTTSASPISTPANKLHTKNVAQFVNTDVHQKPDNIQEGQLASNLTSEPAKDLTEASAEIPPKELKTEAHEHVAKEAVAEQAKGEAVIDNVKVEAVTEHAKAVPVAEIAKEASAEASAKQPVANVTPKAEPNSMSLPVASTAPASQPVAVKKLEQQMLPANISHPSMKAGEEKAMHAPPQQTVTEPGSGKMEDSTQNQGNVSLEQQEPQPAAEVQLPVVPQGAYPANNDPRAAKKQKLQDGTSAETAHAGYTSPQNSPQGPNKAINANVINARKHTRVLPKTVRNRPDNARVFIGNLASEYTTKDEIIEVFSKYGELIEEPVLRRSFGFVQYNCAESARKAVDFEQGRVIGGISIDLSIADNREVKKGTHIANNTPFTHPVPKNMRQGRRDRDLPMSADRSRKRRRSLSPASAAKKGGVHPPQFRRQRPEPKNGIYLRILCMSPTAQEYARQCEATFRSMTRLPADILHIVAPTLGEALGRAMRDVIPYVMVVASKDVEAGTCTIRTLEKTGYEKSGRGNGVISVREAVEVCLIERGLLHPEMGGHQPPPGMGRNGPPLVPNLNQQHHMNSNGGNQWGGMPMNNGGMHRTKPGWMTEARPPHPANSHMNPRANHGGNPQQNHMGSMTGHGNYGGYNSGYNAGMNTGHRGQYGNQMPGSGMGAGQNEYGRGMGSGHPPYNYNQNGMNGNQMPGGEYMRGTGGNNLNMARGTNGHGGYMQGGQGRGNAYGGSRNGREGEYEPAPVMGANDRAMQSGYGNQGWENGDMRGNEMYAGRSQPAITRDRNGGFQTVGGRQAYPGGGNGNYGYERSQSGMQGNQYGGMGGTNYDGQGAHGGYGRGGDGNGQGMYGNAMQGNGGSGGVPAVMPGMGMNETQGRGMGGQQQNTNMARNGGGGMGGYRGMYGGQMGMGGGNAPMYGNGGMNEGGWNNMGGRMNAGTGNYPQMGDGRGGRGPGEGSESGGGVDIGKLTSLINAFQQRSEQQGDKRGGGYVGGFHEQRPGGMGRGSHGGHNGHNGHSGHNGHNGHNYY